MPKPKCQYAYTLPLHRVLELEATFPRDHTLTVQVWDYDAASADDLIGETSVDVESRFYSRHRAHCGLGSHYDVTGYNAWRDRERPCQILRQLCRRNGLPLPEYWEDYVRIGRRKFVCPREADDDETGLYSGKRSFSRRVGFVIGDRGYWSLLEGGICEIKPFILLSVFSIFLIWIFLKILERSTY